jgi:BirA family biotin operon repressor/biotin-[acetyl-CoA-carboxylase] ligase
LEPKNNVLGVSSTLTRRHRGPRLLSPGANRRTVTTSEPRPGRVGETDLGVHDADRLVGRLDAPVEIHGSLGSTNDRLRALAESGAPAGTMLVAEELTAGRGRGGSAWSAPPGGAWTSTLVRPDFGTDHVGRLTFAGGVAACETVRSFGVDARLKWPNDVLVGGSKMSGVLTETVIDGVPVAGKPVDAVFPDGDAELAHAILGIGINADLAPDDLDTDRDVTTLRAETGESVDPTEVVARLHERLTDRVAQVEREQGFAEVLADWREFDATLGSRVRVERRAEEPVVGRAVGLTERGGLSVLPDDADDSVEITEGECRRLRET